MKHSHQFGDYNETWQRLSLQRSVAHLKADTFGWIFSYDSVCLEDNIPK